MNYPIFERPDGFYYSLALKPNWEDRLARIIDIEKLSSESLDDAERTILHFNQLGYSIREISWYYGVNYRSIKYRLDRIFERLALLAAREWDEDAPLEIPTHATAGGCKNTRSAGENRR